ncbi:MAG: hypothetical protein RIT07_1893, partial [Bacteroidota bacterium]
MLKLSLSTIIFTIPVLLIGQYKGTGSVTQGKGQTDIAKLMDCAGGRISALGSITDSKNQNWTVPAVVEYNNTAVPFASDLYNACNGKTYANTGAALAALNGSDIVTIDSDGELITAYVFADNYFEMYINGIAVGKDKVPFTEFNSSIIRFRVKKPFTIAMLLVDWEEALGLGTELNGGFAYHPGDGGMVALFTDNTGAVVAKTDSDWKAQTFYTAPIKDLTCASEQGKFRLSNLCSTTSENDGTNWYGLHWKRPDNWTSVAFEDSVWPFASVFTNSEIGVNNKPSYTNFTDVFDKQGNDARFIWSSNVILDNEVLVRYTVKANPVSLKTIRRSYRITNPALGKLRVVADQPGKYHYTLFDCTGRKVMQNETANQEITFDVSMLINGSYTLHVKSADVEIQSHKIL